MRIIAIVGSREFPRDSYGLIQRVNPNKFEMRPLRGGKHRKTRRILRRFWASKTEAEKSAVKKILELARLNYWKRFQRYKPAWQIKSHSSIVMPGTETTGNYTVEGT